MKDTETNKCYNRVIDGFLDPSKYNLQENKMTDGINLDGFTANRQAAATNNLDLNPTGQAPASAFPATDVSDQATAQGPK